MIINIIFDVIHRETSMDKNTAKLVADLARHLCIELDLNYGDIQLAQFNRDAVDAVERAFTALTRGKARTPEILEHVILRATRGDQHLKTLGSSRDS